MLELFQAGTCSGQLLLECAPLCLNRTNFLVQRTELLGQKPRECRARLDAGPSERQPAGNLRAPLGGEFLEKLAARGHCRQTASQHRIPVFEPLDLNYKLGGFLLHRSGLELTSDIRGHKAHRHRPAGANAHRLGEKGVRQIVEDELASPRLYARTSPAGHEGPIRINHYGVYRCFHRLHLQPCG